MLAKPLDTLAYLASFGLPSHLRVSVNAELDRDPEKWNPEWGPKGKNKCFETDVHVTAIVCGVLFKGFAHMGGSWYTSQQELLANDVSGYLPQMVQEATQEALHEVRTHFKATTDTRYVSHVAMLELHRLDQVLTQLLRDNYDYQQQQYLAKVPETELLTAARNRLIGRVINLHPTGQALVNYSGGRIMAFEQVVMPDVVTPYELVYQGFKPTGEQPTESKSLFLLASEFRQLLVEGTTPFQESPAMSITLIKS